MPIVLPDPPAEGAELIQRHVPYLLAARRITDVFDGADKHFQVAPPQPIYTTTAQDFLDHKALEAAQPIGWQYVIFVDDSVFASAEISDKEDGEWMFTVLRFQAYTRPIADALHSAEELPEIATADYELRILSSSSVSLRAVWLHGPTDVLIPIAQTPRGVDANIKYSEEALTDALSKLAFQRTQGNRFDPAADLA